MSRIEEALKRASVAAGPRNVYALKDSRAAAAEASTLADYPAEGPSESTPVAQTRRVAAAPGPSKRPAAATLVEFPEDLEGKLILKHAAPIAVEQYRRLAATLHELQAAHGVKTLMITSAVPREGKTLTISNLALTLSESYGRRVLLVDADLRRPSIHEVFGVSNNNAGLSEGLRNESAELSLVQLTPRLSILPAGRPETNPMAALTSDRMRALLEDAAKTFDWVLLDAPPVGIMPDANLLARLTQGVIFVLAAGMTPYELVNRAIDEIGRDSIVGVVLNRIDANSIPQTGYYENYYSQSTPQNSLR
jgi:protein-tyrosine kinase